MPANSRSTKSSRKASKKAANKKVAKKKVAKKKVAKKKVAKKTTRRPQRSRQKVHELSAEPRHEMIEKAAYYRAEKRNFRDGDPVADWLACEKEVDALLSRAAP